MASATANVDEDYESDPEEARLSLALRRRVASDDEEGEDDDGVEVRVSDDREGVPEDYDDEEEKETDEGEELRDDMGRDEVGGEIGNEVRGGVVREVLEGEVGDGEDAGENRVDEGDLEKKEHEPFAVPTVGAFYMHDDRLRDNAAVRQRRTLNARKIWESRDERRWAHDKFEELTSQDRNHSEPQRNSKEHHGGRGRNRGTGRGYARGNRPKIAEDNDNQAPVPTIVRGRGPRKYDRV